MASAFFLLLSLYLSSLDVMIFGSPCFLLNPIVTLDSVDQKGEGTSRYYNFWFSNPKWAEGKKLAKSIYKVLSTNPEFKAMGNYKILLSTAFNSTNEFNLHSNVLVNHKTNGNQYYKSIESSLHVNDYGYDNCVAEVICVKVWNMDDLRNQNIKITRKAKNIKKSISFVPKPLGPAGGLSTLGKRQFSTSCLSSSKFKNLNLIKPLSSEAPLTIGSIATLDLETIEYNGEQVPLTIGLAFSCPTSALPVGVNYKSFTLNKDLLDCGIDSALRDLKHYDNIIQYNVYSLNSSFIILI